MNRYSCSCEVMFADESTRKIEDKIILAENNSKAKYALIKRVKVGIHSRVYNISCNRIYSYKLICGSIVEYYNGLTKAKPAVDDFADRFKVKKNKIIVIKKG